MATPATPATQKIALSWSGGKDSAMALYMLREQPRWEIGCLLTVVAADLERISHHGVRAALLRQQAAALGLSLREVPVPVDCTMAQYDAAWVEALGLCRAEGMETVAFGDIFLADLREYREEILTAQGMKGLFPLWGADTNALVRRFIALGFQGRICCVDGAHLSPEVAGVLLDGPFVDSLPEQVDPCGENGEYHSFVFDGPLFSRPVPCRVGEKVTRDTRIFAELLPD